MKLQLTLVGLGVVLSIHGQIITTVAGTSWVFPKLPLPSLSAPLGQVSSVTVDAQGNLYVADVQNDVVLQVSTLGEVSIVAGNGIQGFSGDNGPSTGASLSGPSQLALDSSGNLYIADSGNNRIRKVSAGTITTVAGVGTAGFSGDGGSATSASLNSPAGLAIDQVTGALYVADTSNNVVRTVANGIITTIAGSVNGGFSGDGGPLETPSLPPAVGVTEMAF